VVTIVPFVKALKDRYPNWTFLVSTITETGREAVEQRLAGVAVHCYLPLDFPWVVEAYVRKFRPVAFVFVETELWPNLLKCFARYGIPTFLINGRLSSRSFKRYSLIKGFMEKILSFVDLFLMQSDRDAQRIRDLGASSERVFRTGNMKFDQDSQSSSSSSPAITRSALGLEEHEELIVAGSTHSEEEDALLQCYARLHLDVPDSVLLIAPRHVERVGNVEAKVRAAGFVPVRRSAKNHAKVEERQGKGARVIILDTRGELANVYALGRVTFVGGTLVPVGGHNLLEPARWGKPVYFGPYTDHCLEIAHLLVQAGGGIQVKNAEELSAQLLQAFQNPSLMQRIGSAARSVVQANQGVMRQNLDLIVSRLEDPQNHSRRRSSSNFEVQGLKSKVQGSKV
jgi:3-deoxy-D-manno-octulosonic-acid transferase